MKLYARFMVKRLLRRKTNIILIASSILVLLFVLIMNMKSQDTLYLAFEKQIETAKSEIENYTERLSTVSEDSEESLSYQHMIENCTSELDTYEKIIAYYQDENWPLFYKTYLSVLEATIQTNEILTNKDHSSLKEMMDVDYQQLAYIQYLDQHNLSYTDQNFPIFGLNFITSISEIILPILISICCIYILAQVFTLDYHKGIDTSSLLPIGKTKTVLVKVIVGIGISSFIFLFITVSGFLLATLFSFHTGFAYPFIGKDLNGNWMVVSLLSVLYKWVFLGILFYIAVALFTYLLSIWIKEDVTLFLTSLSIILGGAYLPMITTEGMNIAHNLPITYMNYAKISTGEFASLYGNVNITYSYGMLILVISILFMFGLICITCKSSKKIGQWSF